MEIFGEKIFVFFDGSITENPGGIATYGFIVQQGNAEIYRESDFFEEDSTNNRAEYAAAINAMRWCLANNHKKITLIGDSMIALNGIFKKKRTKSANLIILQLEAKALRDQFSEIAYEWLPSKENPADEISRRGYIYSASPQ